MNAYHASHAIYNLVLQMCAAFHIPQASPTLSHSHNSIANHAFVHGQPNDPPVKAARPAAPPFPSI